MAATTAAVPLVARIKEATLRDEYIRQLAGWLGSELAPIQQRVRDFDRCRRPGGQANRRAGRGQGASRRLGPGHAQRGSPAGRPGRSQPTDRPSPESDRPTGSQLTGNRIVTTNRRRSLRTTRTAHRTTAGTRSRTAARDCPGSRHAPTQPDRQCHVRRTGGVETCSAATGSGGRRLSAGAGRGVHQPGLRRCPPAVEAAGGPPSDGSKAAWVDTVADHLPAGSLRSLVTELAVEPPRHQARRGQRPVRRRHSRRDGGAGGRGGRTQPEVGAAAGRGLGRHRGAGAALAARISQRWRTTGGRWPTGQGGTRDVADRLPPGPGGARRCRRCSRRSWIRRSTSRSLAACADGKLLAASRFGLWVIEDGRGRPGSAGSWSPRLG